MTVIRLWPSLMRFSVDGVVTRPSYVTYGLVEILSLRAGRMVSYADLAAHLWPGGEPDLTQSSIKVTLFKMRRRYPQLQIKTLYGHGLCMAPVRVFLHGTKRRIA